MMLTYFPRQFSSKAIGLYILLVTSCTVLFYSNSLPVLWVGFGIIEVIGFYAFLNIFSRQWAMLPSHVFQKKLFRNALFIRSFYVFLIYFFYKYMTGQPFEFDAADSMGYHFEALWIIDLVHSRQFDLYWTYITGNYSDMGYPLYLSFVYSIFGENIVVVRIIKAVISSFACILIYKLATRNFGEKSGKIAGIAAMLLPNFIYYCGLHLKETEMIFLAVAFIERADLLLRSKGIDYKNMLFCFLIGASLFLFRTVLGITAFFSLFTVLIFSYNRFIGLSKKVAIATWIILLAFILSGGTIQNEIVQYWKDKSTNLRYSMDHRSSIAGGNVFAKYGKPTVFVPVMVVVPLPTIVNIETQQNLMLFNGGTYTKTVYAFFVYIALLVLLKQKRYKQHILLLSFLFTYLGILAFSKFAISERFHMPALPFLVILFSLGVTHMEKKYLKFFNPYLILISIVIIWWNWFKLAGRGLI